MARTAATAAGLVVGLTLLFSDQASQAQQLRAELSFELQLGPNTVFTINAAARVNATPQQVWQVLTDYNRLADFVPEMKSSRRLESTVHDGLNVVRVEQVGEIGIAFFKRDVRVTLLVTERPLNQDGQAWIEMMLATPAETTQVASASKKDFSDLRRFNAQYSIEADRKEVTTKTGTNVGTNAGTKAGTTLLSYHAEIEPDFFVPPLIGTALMRSKARKQFEAVVAEINRQH